MTYRYIYKITCTAGSFAGKFYFGQRTTHDLNDGYKGSGTLLLKYYKKYPNSYTKEIISFYNTQEELNKAEYDIIHPWLGHLDCLNMIEGGGVTDEARKNMSKTRKGMPTWNKGKKGVYSSETLNKMSESLKGRIYSEETRNKLSDSLKGRVPWNKGKKTGPFSEEHKKHISETHKGKTPWNKGKGKKTAWITLDNIHKKIKKEELQKYLDAGWHLGCK